MDTSDLDRSIGKMLMSRGGAIQRSRVKAARSKVGDTGHSSTILGAIQNWGHDGRTAKCVIETMGRVKRDHSIFTHPDIADLASKNAKSVRNCSRKLFKAAHKRFALPPVSTVSTLVYDLKNRPGPIVKEFDQPLILPHDYMEWLFTQNEDSFIIKVAGGYNENQLLNL